MLLGALEAGGTKMVCAIGDENGTIISREVFSTETPETTMPVMIDYFKKYKIEALGLGCFGPIDLNRNSATYGSITTTPKLTWRKYNIVKAFQEELQIPVGFDTDVNCSALGEASFGALREVSSGIYLTIGTGIGAGIIINHQPVHGMLHPEAGHILIRKNEADLFNGCCPYHSNCFEGLASGPAIEKRYGKKAFDLQDNIEVWELEAEYIAQALVNYILTLSPERIILGGGVMHQEQLFPLIRKKTLELLNGYINTEEMNQMDQYIIPPSLNDNQGILGCIKLAMIELDYEMKKSSNIK